MSSHHTISLTYSDLQDLLVETQQEADPWGLKADRMQGGEISWNLQHTFGTWFSRSIHLRDDLDLSITEWDIQETFKLIVDTQTEPLVGFSFCVSGGFRSIVQGSESDLIAHSGETQSGWFQGEVKTISEVTGGQKVSLVQLSINPNLLKALVEEQHDHSHISLNHVLPSAQSGFHWQTGTITPAMTIALYQILQCPYQGLTKQIYLESKSLELIALQVNQLTQQQSYLQQSPLLKSGDIDRIHLAKDILVRNLDHPPSLLSLARQAGINSFKLKQGFRQIFNTTVFGYLHLHRMEEARRLLQLGDLSVAQVALAIGYSNPSKFSAAFKKKFGISPKALRSR